MSSHTLSKAPAILFLFLLLFFPKTVQASDIVAPEKLLNDLTSSSSNNIENIFLIIIDGLRNSEAFKDPTHQYIPHIWKELRPLGTMYYNFYCLGKTDTTPAHYAMASGVTDMLPNKRMHQLSYNIIQEDPSIFQYYRHQLGIHKDATWIINGKGSMMGFMGESVNPFYRDNHSPHVAFIDDKNDNETYNKFLQVVNTYHPSLTVVNLRDVDSAGHTDNWTTYTNTILKADTIVYDICKKIWLDPVYSGNTAIIIASDHGRHLDQVLQGFQHHSCCCMGCRDVPFLVIGPGIKKNAVIIRPGFLRDIAPTIAWMLGFETDLGRGRVLGEMFVNSPPLAEAAWQNPSLAYSSGKLHVAASVRDFVGTSHIYYRNTSDNGQTWSQAARLSIPKTPPQNLLENVYPVIIADDNRVSVVWSNLHIDGRMMIVARESYDGGDNWNDPVFLSCSSPFWAGFTPDACYRNGALYVTWTDAEYDFTDLYITEVKGSQIAGYDYLKQNYSLYSRCEPSPTGIHVVCQKLSDTNLNWNIAYCRHDGNKWVDSAYLSDSADFSLRPDIALNNSGIHVVWAERDNGLFKVLIRNSKNGNTWDSAEVVGESLHGAWRPRITATNGLLAVAWEGYESSKPSIFYSTSTDGGSTWTSPKKIFQNDVIITHPDITVNAQNLMHVVSASGSFPTKLEYANIQL